MEHIEGDYIQDISKVNDGISEKETPNTTPTFFKDNTATNPINMQQPALSPQIFGAEMSQNLNGQNQQVSGKQYRHTFVDEAVYFATINMGSNFNQAYQQRHSSDKGSSKLSSPRGDVHEGNEDEEDDHFSIINNRISSLLIEEGVTPPQKPLLNQKGSKDSSSNIIHDPLFQQSPRNQSYARVGESVIPASIMPSEGEFIPSKFSQNNVESNYVYNFAEIQQKKRPQGNSRSLVNGKNPQQMRVQDYNSDQPFEEEKHAESSSMQTKSQHHMSGDILPASWENNSSDEEINYVDERPVERGAGQYQINNFTSNQATNQQIKNQLNDGSNSIFIGSNGPFSNNYGYIMNRGAQSQNGIDDKQSHHSWGEGVSCGSASDYMNLHPPRKSSAAGPGIYQSDSQFSPNFQVNTLFQNNGQDQKSNSLHANNQYQGSGAASGTSTQYGHSNNQLDQDPQSLFSSPPYTENKFYNRSGSGFGSNQVGYPLNNQILSGGQAMPGGARANSFDKVAKQQQVDFHQNYFGNSSPATYGEASGKGYVKYPSQDLDKYSTKSMGQVSSFSDGAIFNSQGQLQNPTQPGGQGLTLGQLRTYYDAQGNMKLIQQPNTNENIVQQSQHASGFYDPNRQQFSNQILNCQQLQPQDNPNQTAQYVQFIAAHQRQQVPYNGFMHPQYFGQSQTYSANSQNQQSFMLPNAHSYGVQQQQTAPSQPSYGSDHHLNQFDQQAQFGNGYPTNQIKTGASPGKKLYINGVKVTNYSQVQELVGANGANNGQGIPLQQKTQFEQQAARAQPELQYQQHPMSNNMLNIPRPQQQKVYGPVNGGYRIDPHSGMVNNHQFEQLQNGMNNQRVPPNAQYIINAQGVQVQLPNMEGPINIGMTAPVKIMRQNIDFNHEAQHLFNNHNGPMIALQQNIQNLDQQQPQSQQQRQAFNPYQSQSFHPQKQSKPPIRRGGANSTTTASSHGDKDTSYMKQGSIFIPQQLNHPPARSHSGVATPSQQNNQMIPNFDIKSHNSSSYSGGVMSGNSAGCGGEGTNILHFSADQNEKLLRQIIDQFEESQNQDQKFEIIRGNVLRLAYEQTGSRFLQKQLNKSNNAIVSFFLNEIEEHFADLMIDNYGNYFCQKLLQNCSSDQRLTILRVIQHDFIKICCNKKGTHTIQFMFDLINRPAEEHLITQALQGHVVELAQDFQGTHVVQKVLCTFSDESKRQFIFNEVFNNFMLVAKNTNGICVVKKLIQIYSPAAIHMNHSESMPNMEQKRVNSVNLLRKIQENVIDLVQDPYGNYIVQEIIKIWDQSVCRPIFEAIKSKICTLSNQKFSSNVIELCLNMADEELLSDFIYQIRTTDKLANLVRNQYGNYVVQSALKVCQGEQLTDLIKTIAQRLPEVTDRKIRGKWDQILHEAANGNFGRGTKRVEINDTNSQMSPASDFQNSPEKDQSPLNDQDKKIQGGPMAGGSSQTHTEPNKQPTQQQNAGGQSHNKPPKGKNNSQKGGQQNKAQSNQSATQSTNNRPNNSNRQQQQQQQFVVKQNQQVQQQQPNNHHRDSKSNK